MIPKADLIKFCEDRIAAVRVRPLMYGGDWGGVETMLLDMLEMREWARAYPLPPRKDWMSDWDRACAKVYRGGNTALCARLEYDKVTDSEAIEKIYNDVLDSFERAGMTDMDVLSKAHAEDDTYQLLLRGTP